MYPSATVDPADCPSNVVISNVLSSMNGIAISGPCNTTGPVQHRRPKERACPDILLQQSNSDSCSEFRDAVCQKTVHVVRGARYVNADVIIWFLVMLMMDFFSKPFNLPMKESFMDKPAGHIEHQRKPDGVTQQEHWFL